MAVEPIPICVLPLLYVAITFVIVVVLTSDNAPGTWDLLASVLEMTTQRRTLFGDNAD